MANNRRVILGVGVVLAVSAIAGGTWYWQYGREPGVVAKINGAPVMESEVQSIMKMLPGLADKKFSDLESNAKEALVKEIAADRELLTRAKSSDVGNDENVKKQIEQLTNNVIKEAYLRKAALARVTEEQVRARYDELGKEVAGKEETRVRHILVKTEAEADKLAEELKFDSKKFAELAKTKSLDVASAGNGGDLGYVLPGQMVKAFDETVQKMKPGQISRPVQTQFGWHVILVEDRRAAQAAPFEQVSERIKQELAAKEMRKVLEEVINASKIEMK